MGKMLGYMATWTTYGSWLQGEEKGYVKKGKVLKGNQSLLKVNKSKQKGATIRLNKKQREIVREAIQKEAEKLRQKIHSIAVCSNHVHLVTEHISDPISEVVGYYKNAARVALQKNGFVGRVWTRGFDKRYCYDERALKERINYVRRHN